MITIETIRIKLKSFYINKTSKFRAKKINDNSITIISNNCWAGFIYQSYNMEYNSPTIGLFFMPDDYVEFLQNIKKWVYEPIEFINYKESKYYNYYKTWNQFGSYPIGKFKNSDIEIHFLHYINENEAITTWKRRVERINWNKILYKFNDQNGCTQEAVNKFDKLDLKNKLCFISSSNKNVHSNNSIKIKCKNESIQTSYEPVGKSKYININDLINSI